MHDYHRHEWRIQSGHIIHSTDNVHFITCRTAMRLMKQKKFYFSFRKIIKKKPFQALTLYRRLFNFICLHNVIFFFSVRCC